MGSNPSSLPPLEVRGREAKFPFGFHSPGLSGGLVAGNEMLPYSSQMQLRESHPKGTLISYVFCSLTFSISIVGAFASHLLCLYPKINFLGRCKML